ncbi:hypothetical protein CC79DRAFT_687649 [Sarocladium strictum]
MLEAVSCSAYLPIAQQFNSIQDPRADQHVALTCHTTLTRKVSLATFTSRRHFPQMVLAELTTFHQANPSPAKILETLQKTHLLYHTHSVTIRTWRKHLPLPKRHPTSHLDQPRFASSTKQCDLFPSSLYSSNCALFSRQAYFLPIDLRYRR